MLTYKINNSKASFFLLELMALMFSIVPDGA